MNAGRARPAVGIASAVLVIAIWSSFVVVSRGAAKHDLLAYDLAALRLGVAGLIFLPVWLRLGLGGLSASQALSLVAAGGLLYPLFAYAGFRFAPAAHGALFLPGMLPFSTAILMAVILQERMSRVRWISLSLLAGGVLCFALEYLDSGVAPSTTWIGDLLFIGGSTSWALFSVLLKKWSVPPLLGTANVCVGAALIYLPIYLLFLPKQIPQAELAVVVWQGVFQGAIAVAIAMLAYMHALQQLGPARLSTLTAFVPGIAALMAIPLLGEPLTWQLAVGLVFVAVGTLYPVLQSNK